MSEGRPQFRIMKKGYDRFEVDDSILEYENKIAQLENEIANYKMHLKIVEEKFNELKNNYQELSTGITIKERAAEDLARIALKEANMIIETAHSNANSIITEALSTARIVLVDVANVSNEASVMKEDMKAQVNSLMKVIDEFELPEIPNMDWMKGKR